MRNTYLRSARYVVRFDRNTYLSDAGTASGNDRLKANPVLCIEYGLEGKHYPLSAEIGNADDRALKFNSMSALQDFWEKREKRYVPHILLEMGLRLFKINPTHEFFAESHSHFVPGKGVVVDGRFHDGVTDYLMKLRLAKLRRASEAIDRDRRSIAVAWARISGDTNPSQRYLDVICKALRGDFSFPPPLNAPPGWIGRTDGGPTH